MNTTRYYIFSIILCLAAILVAGCTGIDTQGNELNQTDGTNQNHGEPESNESSWISIPFTDAVSGTQSTIFDLAGQGKPVIIHTFAVWCPACSLQLQETKKLVQEEPGAYTVLAIDIDPREDVALVKRHVEKNQFTGMFVASPPKMTISLMETLGTQIIQSLPQTIIVCNKSVVYVGDGVFPKDRLKAILSEICTRYGNQ